MSGGDAYRDYRQLDTGSEFSLADDLEYKIIVTVTRQAVDVYVDNNTRLYSTATPRDFVGKVGLRPWRSFVRIKYFEVSEI